jgi:hypothetical protein
VSCSEVSSHATCCVPWLCTGNDRLEVPSKVQKVQSKAQLDSFLGACKGGKPGGSGSGSSASTGLCLVLPTEKTDVSSLYK